MGHQSGFHKHFAELRNVMAELAVAVKASDDKRRCSHVILHDEGVLVALRGIVRCCSAASYVVE